MVSSCIQGVSPNSLRTPIQTFAMEKVVEETTLSKKTAIDMHLRKAVITAAGVGTRLLPISKELPKEMLPIFSRGKSGLILKPLLQALFEQLYDAGLVEFCFVVGRGKRAIQDHFTPDDSFLRYLEESGKSNFSGEMRAFYEKVAKSSIVWVNQPAPKGFGDAVLMAKSFVGNDDFVVAAGDTYIVSTGARFLKKLVKVHTSTNAQATLLVLEVEDPRQYGVIDVLEDERGLRVISAIEKPETSKSDLAIMPSYIFKPEIFRALESTSPDMGGELQLTDAIQKLVDWGLDVYAVRLDRHEIRLDVGTPQTFWEAIRLSHEIMSKA